MDNTFLGDLATSARGVLLLALFFGGSIFVHELGHWIVLHREGIPAGAPVFIPFLGAFVAMRRRPRDAGRLLPRLDLHALAH